MRTSAAVLMAFAMVWTSARLCLMPVSVCEQKSHAPCHGSDHGQPAKSCCGGVHLDVGITASADALVQDDPGSVVLPSIVPAVRHDPFFTRVAPGPSPGHLASLLFPQVLSRAPPLS